MSTKLTPPDLERCQANKPGPGPFVMGGETGDPRNGWRVRCRNVPTLIATERRAGPDGQRGSMALCDECTAALKSQLGESFATFRAIRRRAS